MRYYDSYSTGDTVGCGINMKTGKMFFTKNGANLGKDFLNNHNPLSWGEKKKKKKKSKNLNFILFLREREN